MSRQIKFRFWSKVLRHMVRPDDSIFIGALNDPNMAVMQYTGLKDKNGVEIYEGDILRLKNSKGQTSNHQEVYWNDETASFDWRTANQDSWPDGFTGFYDEYEVIGNIYENPELFDKAA